MQQKDSEPVFDLGYIAAISFNVLIDFTLVEPMTLMHLELILEKNIELTVFFYNPNIHPKKEDYK